MATNEKDQKEKKQKGGKKEAAAPRGAHPGKDLPVPAPRLREHYMKTVRANLSKQFSLGNPHEVPGLEKIVINVGVGEAIKNPKVLDHVVEELGIITGQR